MRNKEVLISGPAGTGKTRACLEKLNAVALKYPGMRGLIVRQTYRTLSASCVAEFKSVVIDKQLLQGSVKWYGGSGSSPAAFLYDNGSTIELGGMDNPLKIMSTQYDFIFVEEATELTVDGWQALVIRLRNGKMIPDGDTVAWHQLLGACNPGADTHFLKQRADAGTIQHLQAMHEENPRLFDEAGSLTEYGREYVEEGLDKLTGIFYLRYRKGLWVGAEGQIYTDFSNDLIIDSMPKGWESWERYWTVDFGFIHPMVVQCWAEAPDGELYLYREFYRTKRLVEDFAKDILDVVAPEVSEGTRVWIEPKPVTIICDHDAEDRATLARHLRMGTTAAKKNVSRGLQATAIRMKSKRIKFLRSALVAVDSSQMQAKLPISTLSEIPGYVWAPNKEEPLKEKDDGCDAMRYMVAYKDHTSMVRFRRV
jgi:phage terminase large subunit